MAITHATTVAWAGSNGGGISGTVSKSADGESNRELAIAATTADQQFDLDFMFAKLKSIFLLSTVDTLLETNAINAAGGNAITLKANVPLFWTDDCGLANPFTANVTTLYVSPSASVTSTLHIRLLIDTTT